MDTQILLDNQTSIGQIWIASHWLNKLSKKQIVKQDLRGALEMMHSSPDISLRKIGFLVIGMVRILFKKTFYILQELMDVLEYSSKQEKAKKSREISRKRRTLEELSVTSHRSIEVPRANIHDITLSEQTPLSSVKNDFNVNLPDNYFEEVNAFEFATPIRTPQVPSLISSTRFTSRRKTHGKPRNMKKLWAPDKEIYIKKSEKTEDIVQTLRIYNLREISFDRHSMFHTSIFKDIPKTMLEHFKNEIVEESRNESVVIDNDVYYDPPDYFPLPLEPEEEKEEFHPIKQDFTVTLNIVKSAIGSKESVEFSDVFADSSRHNASRAFYDLLIITKKGHLALDQSSMFGPLIISEN